jgi:hypothetical protein
MVGWLFSIFIKINLTEVPCFSNIYYDCTLKGTMFFAPQNVTFWHFRGVELQFTSSVVLNSLTSKPYFTNTFQYIGACSSIIGLSTILQDGR